MTAGLPSPTATSALPIVDVSRFVAPYRQGRRPVDGPMSGRLALDDIDEGFDRLASGEAVRQIVTMPRRAAVFSRRARCGASSAAARTDRRR